MGKGRSGSRAAAAAAAPAAAEDGWEQLVSPVPGGCRIRCFAQPRASRTALAAIHDGALKIAVAAPPVDGEANAALTVYLAKLLGTAKSSVTIESGGSGRHKSIVINGADAATVRAILQTELQK